MDGPTIVQGLLDRGYAPVQAAAIAGNILQESGGDPNAVNDAEGANGLLQWRGDRWTGLQDYAASRNASANDPDVQLDYIGRELAGPEKRNAAGIYGATDLEGANTALKKYIRYGDDSQGTRLSYATGLLNGYRGAPQAGAAPSAPLSLAPQDNQPAPAQAASGTAVPFPTFGQPAAPAAASPQPAPFALVPPKPTINLAQYFANRRGS